MSAQFLENCLWSPFCNIAVLLAWFIGITSSTRSVTSAGGDRGHSEGNFRGPSVALLLCVFEDSQQQDLHLPCSLSWWGAESHQAPQGPGALHSQRTASTSQHLPSHPHLSQSKAGQRLPKNVCRIGPPGVFKTPSLAFIRTHTKRGVSSSFKLCLFILQ